MLVEERNILDRFVDIFTRNISTETKYQILKDFEKNKKFKEHFEGSYCDTVRGSLEETINNVFGSIFYEFGDVLLDAIVEKFLNDVDENTDRKNYRDKILESPSEELFDF